MKTGAERGGGGSHRSDTEMTRSTAAEKGTVLVDSNDMIGSQRSWQNLSSVMDRRNVLSQLTELKRETVISWLNYHRASCVHFLFVSVHKWFVPLSLLFIALLFFYYCVECEFHCCVNHVFFFLANDNKSLEFWILNLMSSPAAPRHSINPCNTRPAWPPTQPESQFFSTFCSWCIWKLCFDLRVFVSWNSNFLLLWKCSEVLCGLILEQVEHQSDR